MADATAPDFFPAEHLQSIIEYTDGVLVQYRGQEAYFHFEDPTNDIPGSLGGFARHQGVAKLLIGDATVFPNLEENTLITVDGDDWLVADWRTPLDGGAIVIALKTTTRT